MSRFAWAGVAALALTSSPVLAADDQGFYVGAGAGIFGIEVKDFEVGLDFDDNDTGFRGFGGWQFSEFLGVEAGYSDGGTASETIGDITVDLIEADVDVDVTGFDVYLTGTLPIGEMFYAYAKAGVMFWDADISATVREDDGEGGVITTQDSFSDSGEDFAYGAGLGMNLGEQASLRLEYVMFDVSDADADFLSANILWRF